MEGVELICNILRSCPVEELKLNAKETNPFEEEEEEEEMRELPNVDLILEAGRHQLVKISLPPCCQLAFVDILLKYPWLDCLEIMEFRVPYYYQRSTGVLELHPQPAGVINSVSHVLSACPFVKTLKIGLSITDAASCAEPLTHVDGRFLTTLTLPMDWYYCAGTSTDAAGAFLEQLLQKCPGLVSLQIGTLTDRDLLAIATHCKHLKRLKLGHFYKSTITDKGMATLFASCRELTELELSNDCPNLTQAVLQLMVEHKVILKKFVWYEASLPHFRKFRELARDQQLLPVPRLSAKATCD